MFSVDDRNRTRDRVLALARSLDPGELLRALEVAAARLLEEEAAIPDLADTVAKVDPQLRQLTRPWDS